jgi:hypothetical protein
MTREARSRQAAAAEPLAQAPAQLAHGGAHTAFSVDDSPRMVAQRQRLAAAFGPAPGGGVAQRQITAGTQTYPSTWKKIPPDLKPAAEDILTRVRAELTQPIDEKKLMDVWNRIANPKHAKQYDIGTEADALVDAIVASYNLSMLHRAHQQNRSAQEGTLVGPMVDQHAHLSYQSSARNPMVLDSRAENVVFDAHDHGNSGAERSATHLATLILSQYEGGEEAQASMRRDGHGIALSTNTNSVNAQLEGRFKLARDLKALAAQVLQARGIASLGRRAAMDDVVVRHSLKLYDRISRYLASDAPVDVPSRLETELDGRHAEIRIRQVPGWDTSTHYPPTGTKYACMGCYLYFHGQHIEIGRWMGPLWVTNPALSTQLEELLRQGGKMGKFRKRDLEALGEKLRDAYGQLPSNARMGKGRTKSGTSTYDRRADSDSEYEEEEFEHLRKRLKARHEGTPQSPQWLGMASGWEPPTPSSSVSEEAQHKEEEEEAQHKEQQHEAVTTPVLDVFDVNGVRYAANDPRIRDGGECLWDTLRHYGFSDEELTRAAGDTELTVDEHVFQDRVWPLVQALGAIRRTPLRVVIDPYLIDGTPQAREAHGDAGTKLFIGLMFDPHGHAHYMPPWSG